MPNYSGIAAICIIGLGIFLYRKRQNEREQDLAAVAPPLPADFYNAPAPVAGTGEFVEREPEQAYYPEQYQGGPVNMAQAYQGGPVGMQHGGPVDMHPHEIPYSPNQGFGQQPFVHQPGYGHGQY